MFAQRFFAPPFFGYRYFAKAIPVAAVAGSILLATGGPRAQGYLDGTLAIVAKEVSVAAGFQDGALAIVTIQPKGSVKVLVEG